MEKKENKKMDIRDKALIFCSILSALGGIAGGAYVGYQVGKSKGFMNGITSANESFNSARKDGFIKVLDGVSGVEISSDCPFCFF